MKNMKAFLVVALALIMLLTGTAVHADAEEKVVRYGADLSDVTTADAHKLTMSEVAELTSHVCDGLLALNPQTLELELALLEEFPTVSEDGLTYSCQLKKGIKFQDGTEVTANDVKYTYTRFFVPEENNVYTWLCDMIKGAKAMLAGEAKELEGVVVHDDYTFDIILEEPYAPFLYVLAAEQTGIYPEKACSEAGDKWGIDTYIGAGPYKMVELIPKEKVVLERYDDYYGEKPEVDRIEYISMDPNTALLEYEAGTIDVCKVDISLVPAYKDNPDFENQLKEVPYAGVITFAWNRSQEPLDNVKVREALTYAIDREALCNGFMHGNARPATTFIPPGVLGYNEDAPELPYDPEKAKSLLEEAGYPDGITITLSLSEKASVIPQAEVIQEQLKASNINLEIQKLDHAANLEIGRAGKKQVSIVTWYCDIPDGDNFFYSILYGDAGIAFSSHYFNDEFDAKCDKARTINDEEEREKVYFELEDQVTHQDYIVAPLYNPNGYILVKDNVEGVFLSRTNLMNFKHAAIVEP